MKVTLQNQFPVVIVQGHNEDGMAAWLLKYYSQTYANPSNDGKGRFGIKIVRNKLNGTYDKSAETSAITDDCDEAMAMISHFSKGAVCPYTLDDMVEAWLSEKALRGNGAPSPRLFPGLHTYHLE